MSTELTNNATGEVITPESITAKLEAMGVDNAKTQKTSETQASQEASKKETVLDIDVSDNNQEFTLVEQEQLKKGWSPGGEKSAEEFGRAGELYGEIKNRGKEIKELKKTIDEMKGFMESQQRAGYEQAVMDLQVQRDEAIEMGNVDEVDSIEAEMLQYEPYLAAPEPAAQPEMHPSVTEFNERHEAWINDSSYDSHKMKVFVAQRANELEYAGVDPSKSVEMIENDLHKEFPNYFNKSASVESDASPATRGRRKTKYSFSDLNPEQKECARHFEKRGIMTKENYIKELIKLGEI